jgi:hypothetical protein
MRFALALTGAACTVLALAAAPAGAATRTEGFAGSTSDGLPISLQLVTTTTTRISGKPRKKTITVTKRIAGVTVRVNSFCSVSGPRTFTARGGFGDLHHDGTFTARGGGVAVRGSLASGKLQGTVSEFQRFGADVCRGTAYFVAS